jgi:hypothetical protein
VLFGCARVLVLHGHPFIDNAEKSCEKLTTGEYLKNTRRYDELREGCREKI